MKTVQINLYSFAELSESARERAISEHGNFLDSEGEQYENEQGEMVTEYPEHTSNEIIESIEANEYLFFANGELASCCTYVGKHPKAGTTEFTFKGNVYQVNN